jgi:hypothetical protein
MWVRLDDGMAHHPKFVSSGPEAMALWVAGLCYCNRYRTRGLIPKLVVPSLLPGLSQQRATELALRLATNAARPSWIEAGDHFRVHDYEEYQPGRDEAGGEVEHQVLLPGEQGTVANQDSPGVTRDGVTRYRNAVTRDGNAAERFGNAPLPGPLPPPRPVPEGYRTSHSLAATWEGERQAAKRAANAERQRRYRRRHAVERSDVTRYVTRYVTRNVTPPVTRYGDATPQAIPSEEREQRRRALNAERQRRFRQRQAAWRAAAAGYAVPACGASHAAAPAAAVAPDGRGGSAGAGPLPAAAGASPFSSPTAARPGVPPPAERDRWADFAAWFSVYPRQEAEIAAQRAWLADPELPPLPDLLERLAVQRAAKPDPRYWLAPDRYLREKRWRDQPPAAPAAGAAKRSVWAQLRAMGSDDGRRQRLREISAAARFDPFAAKGPHD